MQKWFVEFRRFEGTLTRGDEYVNVLFGAAVADTGEIQITLDPIARTRESRFITEHWEGEESEFGKFVLHGSASDGAVLHTDDLFFTTLNLSWAGEAGTMRPAADCTVARFTLPKSQEDQDGIRLLLRGLIVRRPLASETHIGLVTVSQITANPRPGQISGEIRLSNIDSSAEQVDWLGKVDMLLEDLRHALSFALGMMITGPIREVVAGDQRTLLVYSSRSECVPFMAPFQPNSLQTIFAAALRAHIDSPGRLRALHFAITWLVMDAPYSEGRLIAAMTALENLISVHLDKRDSFMQSESQASKLRKAVRAAAQAYAEANVEDISDRARLLSALEVKMPELNRRTLREKIDILAQRWSVSMVDLNTEMIDAAKKARDLIVHTGTFPSDSESELGAFNHMIVARELVVRFILAALNYDGTYGSYVGSYHKREFANGRNERSTW
ncbi:hypothetical protein ASF04_25670 [Duganella sp. Leaf61]|uniref:hypothetical protein n=1 Tax=Duganella sp. Leaf61 TaxID=1736227 RepID=UPI0007015C80|nr:hypothetical protein [Duganella sp. Leaf61]KQN76386.1 hypothetical protein ASF04_25670 [Duganella sp. Leaf61]